MLTESLAYFTDLKARNVLAVKQACESGQRIVGTYCLFAPRELIRAAGAYPVSLCGTSQSPIGAAEGVLPRNLCPLIKASYGHAVTDTCPYFHFSDLLVAETTCDGKKKMYELLSRLKPLHLMELPQGPRSAAAVPAWVEELRRLKVRLEEQFGVSISDEDLRLAIREGNRERRALLEFCRLNREDPPLLSGAELIAVMSLRSFQLDKEEGLAALARLTAALHAERAGVGAHGGPRPRLLLTGCPTGRGAEKVITVAEECGGVVVAMETCTGQKGLDLMVDEREDRDPLEALAERYLQIPCSCMSPNRERLALIGRLAREYRVQGVVDLTWQACHTYAIEAFQVEEAVRTDLGLPYLHLESDYSASDVGQLQLRLGAFIEML